MGKREKEIRRIEPIIRKREFVKAWKGPKEKKEMGLTPDLWRRNLTPFSIHPTLSEAPASISVWTDLSFLWQMAKCLPSKKGEDSLLS
ncbi:hypothetical protein NPIL_26351 [Nephila pilipes]|uniref:Uncharacterized protein n=1 Tax=Nephila pilipes TaxID=299642 RepID=A0A8X6I937_NEPPI|nr:hypothetical protein NPIL_26351 [Nephila pilipes]